MPFQPGQSGNPAGRPARDDSLRALLRRQPVKDKRELVKTAYKLAKEGDSRWAEWIAKHSGEGAALGIELTGRNGGPVETATTIVRNVPELDPEP